MEKIVEGTYSNVALNEDEPATQADINHVLLQTSRWMYQRDEEVAGLTGSGGKNERQHVRRGSLRQEARIPRTGCVGASVAEVHHLLGTPLRLRRLPCLGSAGPSGILTGTRT